MMILFRYKQLPLIALHSAFSFQALSNLLINLARKTCCFLRCRKAFYIKATGFFIATKYLMLANKSRYLC